MYEKAVKLYPTNEELETQLFYCLVRLKDYKKQQHIALKMYKLYGTTKYVFWGIMSVLLQGNCVEGDPKLFYSLARKMIQKCVDEDMIKTVEELHLLLAILLESEEYDEALKIMKSEIGNLFTNQIEKSTMMFELMKKVPGGWEQIEENSEILILEKK